MTGQRMTARKRTSPRREGSRRLRSLRTVSPSPFGPKASFISCGGLAKGEAGSCSGVTRARDLVGYVLTGLGLGGLVDGFVLHQLLQWHHLWSSKTTDETVAGLEENTLADGIFHVASLVVLIVGIGLVVGRRVEWGLLIGLVLVGWGLFHVLDQLVFHLGLGAHHIRMDVDNPEIYDWTFTGIGIVLVLVGWVVTRFTPRAEPSSRSSARGQGGRG